MQGHGYAQPVKEPPHTVWLVLLRVLFVAIAVFSLGFLTWVTQLRLAAVTRKSLDWGLFVAVLAADVLSVVLVGSEPGEEIHTTGGYLGMAVLLGTLAAAVTYYLVADIRHFRQRRQAGAQGHAMAAYGYPGPASMGSAPVQGSPFTATTVPTAQAVPRRPLVQPLAQPPFGQAVPQPPLAGPVPSVPATRPHPSVPQASVPAPQRPQPARIDQVRAELDELSDYLRKHDTRREGAPGSTSGGIGDGRGEDDHEGGR